MKKTGSTIILVITVMLFAVAVTLAGLALYLNAANLAVVKKDDPEPIINTTEEAVEAVEENSELYLTKLKQIDSIIQDSYLKDYDRENQMEEIYRTMLDSLDDQYSRYLSPEELKQLRQDLNSTFTGTGIVFIKDENNSFLVTEVIAGGPASVAGIKEGDIIIKADGKEYSSSQELIDALKGDPGTKVELTISRDDKETDFSVLRGDVRGSSVESRSVGEDDIGYIRIRTFGEDTSGLFESSISAFENGMAKGLILDLRNNPGGLFDEGVKVADRILPECLVSYTVDRNGNKNNYNSDSKKSDLKIVVLVNENTASTAEMLAATIKGNNAGTVVGVKTYGKGLIQETHTFEDGSAINITTREFFGPEGLKIDGVGVEPDTLIENPEASGADPQLDEAIKIINGK